MHRCSNCGYEAAEPFRFCPECGLKQVDGGADPLVGRTIGGRYRVEDRIGEGSTGMVYRAEHISLKRQVAVKILHRDLEVNAETLSRFQREGMIVSQFDHPNAIQIFDLDRDDDGLLFLAMELVDGPNLKQVLQKEGPMDADRAVDLMRQLLSVLQAAHDRGIIHRDLKPENLMLLPNEAERPLKVLDFGLSKLVNRPSGASLMTMTGHVMGTPLYMSPEQWQGQQVDHRTDLYSAGLVFYELLTGKQAHSGSDLTEIFVARTQKEPPSLAEIDDLDPELERFDEVIGRALARDLDDRYESAAEMLEDLEEAFEEEVEVTPRRTRTTVRSTRNRARRPEVERRSQDPKLLIGAGVVVLAVGLWAAGVFSTGEKPSQTRTGQQGPSSTRTSGYSSSNRLRTKPEAERTQSDRDFLKRLDLALANLRGGDLEEARRAAQTAANLRNDAEALWIRAQVFRADGDIDLAKEDLREAIQLDSRYAEPHALLGLIAIDEESDERAASHFDDALDRDPDCEAALGGRGAVALLRKEPEQALAILEPLAEARRDSGLIQLWYGETLLALDRAEDAIDALRIAVRKAPQELRGDRALARAYFATGQREKAVRQLERVLSSTSATAPRIDLAELLLGNDDPDKAVEILDPISSRLEDGRALSIFAAATFASGDQEGAEPLIRRALSADPPNPAALHRMQGLIEVGRKDFEAARASAEAAVEADDTRAKHWSLLGLAEFRTNRFEDAKVSFEEAFSRDSGDPFVAYSLGILYMDYFEEPEEAVRCFRAYQAAGGQDPKVVGFLRKLTR